MANGEWSVRRRPPRPGYGLAREQGVGAALVAARDSVTTMPRRMRFATIRSLGAALVAARDLTATLLRNIHAAHYRRQR